MKDWIWHGDSGHFCGASKCCFRLHTTVGRYKVSTVGCYHTFGDEEKIESIGLFRHFETYVFDLEAKEHEWSEIDSEGLEVKDGDFPEKIHDYYKKANAMHLKMCRKWSKKK